MPLQDLQGYNRTTKTQAIGRNSEARLSGRDESRRSSDSRSRTPSKLPRSRTSSEPPNWAKELLKQPQAYAVELKLLQGEIFGSKAQKAQQPRPADP